MLLEWFLEAWIWWWPTVNKVDLTEMSSCKRWETKEEILTNFYVRPEEPPSDYFPWKCPEDAAIYKTTWLSLGSPPNQLHASPFLNLWLTFNIYQSSYFPGCCVPLFSKYFQKRKKSAYSGLRNTGHICLSSQKFVSFSLSFFPSKPLVNQATYLLLSNIAFLYLGPLFLEFEVNIHC